MMAERGGPMLLFDRIKGYPEGYRIAAKPYSTDARTALALDLPEGASAFEMFQVYRERIRSFRGVPPVEVSSGPVMQNVLEDERVDLTRFPTPVWHQRDGGPYFGTGCTVVTRDPDEGWVNAGTYRCQLHDARTTGVDIAPYHHGNLHMLKWWAQGKAAPVAVAVSVEPYIFLASTQGLPWATNEYEFAGFLKGEPIEVLRAPRTGLPVPANAELFLEGVVPPPEVETRTEGPFGEYTGYYAGGEKPAPVIHVQAVYYRTDPILHGEPPMKPPVDNLSCPPAGSIPRVWEGLERCGIPGIKGVYTLSTGGGFTTVVAMKQQYAGHARQVGRVASGLMHSMCRMMIVVDEDIDPSNAEEVLWAVATRSDPETTWEIQPECPSGTLDPIISPQKKKTRNLTSSRAVIVACRPWEWMDQFPAVNRASPELRQRTLAKWAALFD
jgi:4-hydroxy-3-polyprenylbenzoate decarboxylase